MSLDCITFYNTFMLVVTYILESLLHGYVCSYYFKIPIKKMISLMIILTLQQYYINNDYLINEFDDQLRRINLSVEKEIFIEKNSYINDLKHVDKINMFLNEQLEYLKSINIDYFHLTIQQKGDFVLFKGIYNVNKEVIINKMIIRKDDDYD